MPFSFCFKTALNLGGYIFIAAKLSSYILYSKKTAGARSGEYRTCSGNSNSRKIAIVVIDLWHGE